MNCAHQFEFLRRENRDFIVGDGVLTHRCDVFFCVKCCEYRWQPTKEVSRRRFKSDFERGFEQRYAADPESTRRDLCELARQNAATICNVLADDAVDYAVLGEFLRFSGLILRVGHVAGLAGDDLPDLLAARAEAQRFLRVHLGG